VCSVSEPLVKVLRLVDSDKLVVAYLYESMDRDKGTIWSYYVGKGTPSFSTQMMLHDLIDSQWTEMVH
jgi:hypothetical protein